MKNSIVSGIIGALIITLIIVIAIAFIAPIDYAPVYLLNPEKALSYNNTLIVDSIKCAHIEVLNDLESKGVLLNPTEYTSHIAEYYNTLISFLLGCLPFLLLVQYTRLKQHLKKKLTRLKKT